MNLSLLYDHCLVTRHPQVLLTQQQLEAEMKATLEEVGDQSARINSIEKTNPKNPKVRDLRQRREGPKSLHGEPCTGLDFQAA